MDTRTVVASPQRVPVVCPNCKTRSEFVVGSQTPVEQCPTCGQRLALRLPQRQVVSR